MNLQLFPEWIVWQEQITPRLWLYFNSRVYLKAPSALDSVIPSFPIRRLRQGSLGDVSWCWSPVQFVTSCFLLSVSMERLWTPGSEAWRRIPDPEADKRGLDSAYEGGLYMPGSLGAAVISPPVRRAPPVHRAPAPVQAGPARPGSQPRDSPVIQQTFW